VNNKNNIGNKTASWMSIYMEIREQIINQEILPGQHLSEHQLAEQFNVSRTPIRSALQKLEAENFVEIEHNKGAIVKNVTTKDLADLFQVRATLEKLATEIVCGDKLLVEKERQLIELMKKASNENNVRLFTKLDEEFHYNIVKATDNRELKKICEGVYQRTYIFRLRGVAMDGQMDRSLKAHEEILEMISSNNPKEAGEKAHQHVMDVVRTLSILLFR